MLRKDLYSSVTVSKSSIVLFTHGRQKCHYLDTVLSLFSFTIVAVSVILMCTFNRCSAKTSTVLLLFLIAGLCFSLMAGKNVTILSLFCHYSVSPLMLSQLNECVHLTDVAQRPLQFCYFFQAIDCAFHSWQAKMSLS